MRRHFQQKTLQHSVSIRKILFNMLGRTQLKIHESRKYCIILTSLIKEEPNEVLDSSFLIRPVFDYMGESCSIVRQIIIRKNKKKLATW